MADREHRREEVPRLEIDEGDIAARLYLARKDGQSDDQAKRRIVFGFLFSATRLSLGSFLHPK